jgi:hypothetical protein
MSARARNVRSPSNGKDDAILIELDALVGVPPQLSCALSRGMVCDNLHRFSEHGPYLVGSHARGGLGSARVRSRSRKTWRRRRLDFGHGRPRTVVTACKTQGLELAGKILIKREAILRHASKDLGLSRWRKTREQNKESGDRPSAEQCSVHQHTSQRLSDIGLGAHITEHRSRRQAVMSLQGWRWFVRLDSATESGDRSATLSGRGPAPTAGERPAVGCLGLSAIPARRNQVIEQIAC